MKAQRYTDDQLAFWSRLDEVRAEPVAALLDELALHDLVSVEIFIGQSTHEDAEKARKYCADARAAKDAMRAGYWLRRAMVSMKDFMLWDSSIRGDKFQPGKPKGSLGPIAKRIRNHLARNPAATAVQVWAALETRPPKGHEFYGKTARLERYIRKQDGEELNWRRFQNLVSEHRPKK